MKKLLLIVLALSYFTFVNAQNYDTLYIQGMTNFAQYHYCTNEYDGVVVFGEPNWNCEWIINGETLHADHIELMNNEPSYVVNYMAGVNRTFYVHFHPSNIQDPFAEHLVWKRQSESIRLNIPYEYEDEYEWEWSNGSTDYGIDVTNDGVYTVTFTSIYGCELEQYFFSVEVRDNVELYRATVDLETNLNKATWEVTAEQAEYISEVKVYRDGLLVGTMPYEDGYYLDAIGSDNAARNYKIIGITPEGEDCPIASYEKGTIHTTYYEDVNHNLNMTWNVPYVEEGANGTLTYFQICKYDPATGDLTVVDQVNAAVTDYTCGVNQFDGGQAVIAAVFSDNKGLEELSFSNLTMDILGIGENGGPSTGSGTLIVYPNPAKDRVTIEGTGTAIITNALGQTIMTKEIDGTETVELPKGLYFVKMNGVTRKVVVE